MRRFSAHKGDQSNVAAVVGPKKALGKKGWDDTGWDKSVAEFLLTYLASLRIANKNSARWLTAAISFEIAGITLTAVRAFLVMAHLA